MVLSATVFNGIVLLPLGQYASSFLLLAVGVLGVTYLAAFYRLIVPSPNFRQAYSWINAILTSIDLVLLTYLIPDQLDLYVGVLLVLAVISNAIYSRRGPSYLLIVLTTLLILLIRHSYLTDLQEWTFHLSIAVIAGIIVETVEQLKKNSPEIRFAA